MGVGTSTFVTRWINFLTMLLAIAVIIFGVWMSTHHDGCRKSLTLPVISLGAVIFIISIVGFLGALKNNSILLWVVSLLATYLRWLHRLSDHVVLRLVGNTDLHSIGVSMHILWHLTMLLLASIFGYKLIFAMGFIVIVLVPIPMFIVTNDGSGHRVTGLRYKEYQLHDYSSWFLKELNNSHNWERLRGCLVNSEDCNNLSKKYKTLKQYKSAKLTPIEAGCCRPPSQCGYPAVNASYYDLTYHPVSSNIDCKRYKNSRAIKCYDCDSCKAGVAQYMKTEWRVVAIFNVILFVVLCIIYFVGCCARRNAARSHSKG
ncbi:hypothetical protein RIF29_34339 [Crotalaria pallida]|uniref:Tetraspanin-10 n=1 Tax=Crotalaria pallida TaxID=3830 RepID=A0AAN9E8U1_CROPI